MKFLIAITLLFLLPGLSEGCGTFLICDDSINNIEASNTTSVAGYDKACPQKDSASHKNGCDAACHYHSHCYHALPLIAEKTIPSFKFIHSFNAEDIQYSVHLSSVFRPPIV